MSEQFNFGRFLKVLRRDAALTWYKPAAYMFILIVFWGLYVLTDNEYFYSLHLFLYDNVIPLTTMIGFPLVASHLLKNVQTKRGRAIAYTLPASSAEKFLSRFVMFFLLPMIIFAVGLYFSIHLNFEEKFLNFDEQFLRDYAGSQQWALDIYMQRIDEIEAQNFQLTSSVAFLAASLSVVAGLIFRHLIFLKTVLIMISVAILLYVVAYTENGILEELYFSYSHVISFVIGVCAIAITGRRYGKIQLNKK